MKKKNKTKVLFILLGLVVCLAVFAVFLMKSSSDKPNGGDEITTDLYENDVEDYAITTSYGDVRFPKKWKQNIRTNIVNEEGIETVQFFASIDNKEEVHLFDLVLGGDDFELGQIVVSEESKVAVSLKSYLYELDESWTDEEKLVLSSIEFDINYLIQSLDGITGFEKW